MSCHPWCHNSKDNNIIKNTQFIDKHWPEENPSGLEFENCHFINNVFASAEFNELKAYRCQFINCRFSHANFSYALFDSCSFYDVETDTGPDFSYVNLKFAQFLDCDLTQANFKHTELFGITIKGCKVLAGKFEQANFCNRVSPKVIFAQAEITQSILRFSRFSKVYLAQCNLSENDFTEADFSFANCNESDFSQCVLNEANFSQASLEEAELQGSDISNIDLTGCKLKGLIISSDQAFAFLKLFGIEVK
ncbi:MAG: pentapeptide repeat-containing protein [Gammaproteobacteria bacterium]|nr:pentapeptide repeat-containing protein [Gammaproteobacteria bacterium]